MGNGVLEALSEVLEGGKERVEEMRKSGRIIAEPWCENLWSQQVLKANGKLSVTSCLLELRSCGAEFLWLMRSWTQDGPSCPR